MQTTSWRTKSLTSRKHQHTLSADYVLLLVLCLNVRLLQLQCCALQLISERCSQEVDQAYLYAFVHVDLLRQDPKLVRGEGAWGSLGCLHPQCLQLGPRDMGHYHVWTAKR